MNRQVYEVGYNKTFKSLSDIDLSDDSCLVGMLSILRWIDENARDIDMFLGARDAFGHSTFKDKNIVMCLCSPITMISKLRGLGFVGPIYSLMTDVTVYTKPIMDMIDFDAMFMFDDRGMSKRALVGYIMDIPDDAYPLVERFMDLKSAIWDKCLDIASHLKEKYSVLCGSTLDELTQIVIDCSYGDAIGNDNTGMETFYNKFVDLCVINIREIGGSEIHSYIINKLTEVGEFIAEQLDWFWRTYPQRLMLYERLKVQLFRIHPELTEDWTYLDRKDIFVYGKEKW